MKKISQIISPALAGVIREKTARSTIAKIKNCIYDGADMIDLHMSCLEDAAAESIKSVIGASKVPVLALNYNKKYDWSDCGFSEEERVKSFLDAVSAGAAGSLSRIINPVLGGHIAFCVDRYNEGSTMEQLDLKTARRIVDDMKKIL